MEKYYEGRGEREGGREMVGERIILECGCYGFWGFGFGGED